MPHTEHPPPHGPGDPAPSGPRPGTRCTRDTASPLPELTHDELLELADYQAAMAPLYRDVPAPEFGPYAVTRQFVAYADRDQFSPEHHRRMAIMQDRHNELRGRPSFTCPECGATSYHPCDVREGYCGACHAWTGTR